MSRNNSKEAKSTDELKNMIMSFRIAELQTLLATCGRSRSGRKHELLGRAVSLLKSSEGSAMRERVKGRILELYHQRYSNGSAPTPPPMSNGNGAMPASTVATTTFPLHTSQPYSIVPNYQTKYSQPPQIYDRSIHSSPIVPTSTDVKFISLPFYELQDVLYKAIVLQPKTITGFQDQIIQYHLTPYQTQLITNSRSVHIKSMIEHSVQVQIRFCLNETSKTQEDLYPTKCKLFVNGKGIPLPGQPPPNAQNQEPRKPHRPVNITSYCRLSPMASNQIQVQWMPSDPAQRFAATVHLVKIVQTETLIQQLETKPIRSKTHSIDFIKEKLASDPDSEVAMTSLKVSLCCPIGRIKMNMPCRGNNCKHLQCFDGSLYIQMNERKPSWVCPVCDQKAYFSDLFKDGLFTSIIAEASNCEDIVFFEDGSWRPLEEIQEASKPLPETPKQSKPPASVENCDTPPVLCISTPTQENTAPPPSAAAANIQPMASLDSGPRDTGVAANGTNGTAVTEVTAVTAVNGNNSNGTTDPSKSPEDVEVIVLDDSDDEETTITKEKNMAEGLELYKLLPHEDRIAAAMYLDQNGILSGQNGGNPKSNAVIDISDE